MFFVNQRGSTAHFRAPHVKQALHAGEFEIQLYTDGLDVLHGMQGQSKAANNIRSQHGGEQSVHRRKHAFILLSLQETALPYRTALASGTCFVPHTTAAMTWPVLTFV